MKNRLTDLNNHLFSQLERLTDEDMSAEKIEQEVKRADAIVAVSEQIIRNADTALKAAVLVANHGDKMRPMLAQFFQGQGQGQGQGASTGPMLDYSKDSQGGGK